MESDVLEKIKEEEEKIRKEYKKFFSKVEVLSLKISKELLMKIKREAIKRKMTQSEFIRFCIEKELERSLERERKKEKETT